MHILHAVLYTFPKVLMRRIHFLYINLVCFFVICFFTASEPDDEDFVLCELLKPPKDASYEVCRICE